MGRLVLIPEYNVANKDLVLRQWKSGTAFRMMGTNNYASINSLGILRCNYTSIVIQYGKGIIEV